MNYDNIVYSSYLSLKMLSAPAKFSSIISRLQSMYGEDITVADLLEIKSKDFIRRESSAQLYLKKFKKLKSYLRDRVEIEDDFEKPRYDLDAVITDVPEKYLKAYLKFKGLRPEIRTYGDLCNVTVDDFCFDERLTKREINSLASFMDYIEGREFPENKKHTPPTPRSKDEILETADAKPNIPDEDIATLENSKLSATFLSKDERKLLAKFTKSGFTYDDLTPLFIMRMVPARLSSLYRFGARLTTALNGLQNKIMLELKSENPAGMLIPKDFSDSLSLKKMCSTLISDIDIFYRNLQKDDAIMWAARCGYGTKQLTLAKIGEQFSFTRERIRQLVNYSNSVLQQSTRISPQALREKLNGISPEILAKNTHELRSLFNSENDFIGILAFFAQIDHKEVQNIFQPNHQK